MGGLQLADFLLILPTLLFIVLLMTGCVPNETEFPYTEIPHSNESVNLDNQIKFNQCGILRVQEPLFNVTGFLTTGVRPNSTIRLFIVPDTSLNSALYVVQHCWYLLEEPIHSEKYFRFDYLPVGNYVAMVARSAFYQFQGFPIINEFNRSNYSARVNFHGGDYRYSLGSFSIFPISDEPKTEK
jgi:hypothetical protein